MRRILVDHARQHLAEKRGGRNQRISITAVDGLTGKSYVDLLALHETLNQLESLNSRQCRIVELRFFGGLTIEEDCRGPGLGPRHHRAGLETGPCLAATPAGMKVLRFKVY